MGELYGGCGVLCSAWRCIVWGFEGHCTVRAGVLYAASALCVIWVLEGRVEVPHSARNDVQVTTKWGAKIKKNNVDKLEIDLIEFVGFIMELLSDVEYEEYHEILSSWTNLKRDLDT